MLHLCLVGQTLDLQVLVVWPAKNIAVPAWGQGFPGSFCRASSNNNLLDTQLHTPAAYYSFFAGQRTLYGQAAPPHLSALLYTIGMLGAQ